MATISIVYYSSSGTTALLAEAVARGARRVVSSEVQVFAIRGEDIVQGRWQNDSVLTALNQSDAIVFGTPTYLGNVAAQFKAFADATGGVWYRQEWKDKLAGGFTISGSASGDKLSTLNYLSTFAAQHGMNWVSTGTLPAHAAGSAEGVNRLGSFLGVMAHNTNQDGTATLDRADALTGEAYGQRVAEMATRFQPVAA